MRLGAAVCACCLFWGLIGALVGLLLTIPGLGFVLGLAFGIGYTLAAFWAAERFILDAYRARPLYRVEAPRLYELVEELCYGTDLDPPLLYAMPGQAPNALVVARRERSAAIAVTNGLTRALTHEQVRAVLALMLARVETGQAGASSAAAMLAGMPLAAARSAPVNDTLADYVPIDPRVGLSAVGKLVLSLFSPLCVALLRLALDPGAIIRSDRRAAQLAGSADDLASALAAIEAALPAGEAEFLAGSPAMAWLFAVPLHAPSPAAALSPASPPWVRLWNAFLSDYPSAAARAARLTAP